MASLPNPKPQIIPAALNRFGRDPESPSEKLRKQSNYEKDTGYAPFFHALRADIYRLASGKAGLAILLEALAESLGRARNSKDSRPEWTPALKIKDLAQIVGSDERTVEREIVGLEKREVAEVKRTGRGAVALRLRFREWEKLPDYQAKVIDISTAEEFDPEEDEQKAKNASRVELTRKPQPARAGKSSRSIPVNCGVKAFRFQNDSVIDLSFTAVVQAGELILSSQVPNEWLKKALKQAACQTNGTSKLEKAIPTPVSGSFASPSPNTQPGRSKSERRNEGEEHPRAKEVSALFDPILLKSHAKLLSADFHALNETCEAAGACDHNFLVKFVIARAARPITNPTHCRHIAAEAARNWAAVKDLPSAQQLPAGKKPLSPSAQRIADRLEQRFGKAK